MRGVSKIALVALLCLLISIAFALAWLLISSITVAPWLEESLRRSSLILACGFLLFVSLMAILYGIAKGSKPRIKESKVKRVFAWILFFTLPF